MRFLDAAWHRAMQLDSALRPVVPAPCFDLARDVLAPAELEAFVEAPCRDRAHQCRVALALLQSGADDPALLAAGLLHDIGKSSGSVRPSVVDRVVVVLLASLAPGLLRHAGSGPARRRFAGLSVAVRHAELGASRLRRLGADPYVVWLVRHHHREDIVEEPALASLRLADRSVS